MQRFSNKSRRPKAKAAEGSLKKSSAEGSLKKSSAEGSLKKFSAEGSPRVGANDWHEIVTRGLVTALVIFIAFQLLYALPGQCAVAGVGDRIVINAGSAREAGAPVITAAQAASGQTCRLDIATMKHPGGVLTVLEASPGGVLLSWAGGATAQGAADCQRHEIAISANDYVTLLNLGPQNINAR